MAIVVLVAAEAFHIGKTASRVGCVCDNTAHLCVVVSRGYKMGLNWGLTNSTSGERREHLGRSSSIVGAGCQRGVEEVGGSGQRKGEAGEQGDGAQ